MWAFFTKCNFRGNVYFGKKTGNSGNSFCKALLLFVLCKNRPGTKSFLTGNSREQREQKKMDRWGQFSAKEAVPDSKFDELLLLWKDYQANKTSNIDLLRHKIDRKYEAFFDFEKQDFTRFMVNVGALPENVVSVLKMYNGVLSKLT